MYFAEKQREIEDGTADIKTDLPGEPPPDLSDDARRRQAEAASAKSPETRGESRRETVTTTTRAAGPVTGTDPASETRTVEPAKPVEPRSVGEHTVGRSDGQKPRPPKA